MRKAIGKHAGFALGQIDQDIGNLGGFFGQIDATNGIRLVFGLRQPFGLGV
jgi:hypothetical protein